MYEIQTHKTPGQVQSGHQTRPSRQPTCGGKYVSCSQRQSRPPESSRCISQGTRPWRGGPQPAAPASPSRELLLPKPVSLTESILEFKLTLNLKVHCRGQAAAAVGVATRGLLLSVSHSLASCQCPARPIRRTWAVASLRLRLARQTEGREWQLARMLNLSRSANAPFQVSSN